MDFHILVGIPNLEPGGDRIKNFKILAVSIYPQTIHALHMHRIRYSVPQYSQPLVIKAISTTPHVDVYILIWHRRSKIVGIIPSITIVLLRDN